jgi:hypothetical protein
MSALTVYFRPDLPAALRRQVDRLSNNNGPTVRFGDMVWETAPPEFDPDAQRCAEALRPHAEPASRETIEAWMLMAVACIGGAPSPGSPQYASWLAGLVLVCGKLPGACWSEATLEEALGKFTFWPSIAEIKALLQPHADQLLATLRALDRIAAAERAPRYQARASTVPYVLPPPPPLPARGEGLSKRDLDDPHWDEVTINPLVIEAQLAALGYRQGTSARAELKPIDPTDSPIVKDYLAKGKVQPDTHSKSLGAVIRQQVPMNPRKRAAND